MRWLSSGITAIDSAGQGTCDGLGRGRVSERRARRARVGAAACFLLTGVISASWASRVPAIKGGLSLSDGEFAIALLGLEAGAVLGLQLGGLVVPRTGSRKALAGSLLMFSGALLGAAVAPNLPVLAASLFLFAALNSIVDVAMNAQGVAVQRLMGRPVLSGLHAMHSLGGVLGAGAGALAARLGVAPSPHFLLAAAVTVVAGPVVIPLLLPSRVDAESSGDTSADMGGLRRWFSGWSGHVALLGSLAFCFTLAEGAGLNWSAVYVADDLGGSEALGAIGLGVFLGMVTLGRLAGDRFVSRFGAVRVFRVGAVVAGAGFGGALLVDAPVAGLIGLGLLGMGIANALPLAIAAGGKAPGETPATAAARVSTVGYLGSFVGPVLVGGMASLYGLPFALGLPALLVLATAFGARVVRQAG
ncbi:MAG TPA: MFS transporter [Rubrobacteraceae bacterium]|jgi:fucose permease|nr:MFS transporter [Rubrobacteraceae bacterium]